MNAPVELHDAIALRYDNGAVGTLGGGSCHLGSGNNKHQLEIRAIGSKGQIHVDVEREIVWRYRNPRDDIRLELEPEAGLYDCKGPIDALVDLALGRQVENCSTIELGARTVEILDAVYRSARSGQLEPVRR
jgi:predicted dehydrogenase